MGRSPSSDENGLKKGPWTPEEDQKLVDYIHKNGLGSWRALPKLAGLNRCGKSCRLRWTNYLRPDIKRGKFSQDEEQSILHLHFILGNKWSAIASHLPGRTDNEVKNYWNTHLKKKLIQMGFDPMTHQPRTDLFSSLPHLIGVLANMKEMIMEQYQPFDQDHAANKLQADQALQFQYLQYLLQSGMTDMDQATAYNLLLSCVDPALKENPILNSSQLVNIASPFSHEIGSPQLLHHQIQNPLNELFADPPPPVPFSFNFQKSLNNSEMGLGSNCTVATQGHYCPPTSSCVDLPSHFSPDFSLLPPLTEVSTNHAGNDNSPSSYRGGGGSSSSSHWPEFCFQGPFDA